MDTGSHDLRLPNWGPYTKKYIGISHIADHERGLRFDLSVFPGLYRRKVNVPNVMWESDYHPWEAVPDLSYYAHRHEIEWKDQVYCDVSFTALSDHARLVRCKCVNRSDRPQSLVLHYLASIQFPTLGASMNARWLCPWQVQLPANAIWADALDYEQVTYAHPAPACHLMPDGLYRGEVRRNGFVNGSGLGRQFGQSVGDRVVYKLKLTHAISNALLLLRYRMDDGVTVLELTLPGIAPSAMRLSGNGHFNCARIALGDMPAGTNYLTLQSQGGAPVELDGMAIVAAADADKVEFTPLENHPVPIIESGPIAGSIILKYTDIEHCYGIRWTAEPSEIREYHGDDLDRLIRHTVNINYPPGTHKAFYGVGADHYTDIYMRPVELAPSTERVVYGMVCAGDHSRVTHDLAEFDADSEVCEQIVAKARLKLPCFTKHPAGNAFGDGQARMAATTAMNVVFPAYIRRNFVRHYTPGRWWDSLYTWDAGFIGLGLLELDIERAVDCLNAYLTAPGDPHAAFIHHGSPVPVQIYLFLELWNRTQSRELLEYFYPRLRQYHAFMAGRAPGSTTRALRSNLLATWDYFYSSGGWDDYPPQLYLLHNRQIRSTTAPVCVTAHAIRTAKILRMAAETLGASDDINEYDADIAVFETALQQHAWDEDSGYFGYVRHDAEGRPTGIFRHASGQNFNMGLDGIYPLVAGICTENQREILLKRMLDSQRLWCRYGLSTVDQSASYFRTDGYWNGGVWMPHQWFFWKALLDQGRPDMAFKIAQRALKLWSEEVDQTYNCWELFMVSSGRGSGWHQFSGLSTPVLSWYGAYYQPGRLTTGFDVWVNSCEFSGTQCTLRASLKRCGNHDTASHVIVSMAPSRTYQATWNGQPLRVNVLLDGVLDITLPQNSGMEGELRVGESGNRLKPMTL